METTKRELINNSQLLRIPISAHLRDHKIGGRVVLSAASLLSVIFDRRSNDRQIGDVVFLKRVFVDDHNVCLKYIEKTEGIEIVDSENSLVFAAAEIRNDKKLKNVQTELLNNFESNEKAELVMHDHFYDFMHQTGYEHSGDFTAVHWLELKEENGIASGTVVMCPSTHLDSQLDGLWQSMVYAAMKREDTTVKLLVPFSLEAIEWQKNEDRRLNHRFASTGRFVLNLKEKRGDFILYDSRTDRILVTGTGISFRSVEINKSQPPTSVQKKIGIRAMSCRLPGGVRSAEDFWRLLSGGKTTDQRIPSARLADRNSLIRGQRYAHQLEGGNFIDGGGQSEEVNEIAGFDCRLFGWSANEAKAADPQQRLVMRCAYECVEKAGLLTSDHRQLRRMGVFVGQMGSAEYADMHSQSEDNGNPNNDALLMLGAQPSVMSGRLSHFFDARGESIVIDSACSSSLVAMNLACSALSNGQIDFALVAGVNVILSTRAMGQRANGQLLAADGRCKSFDSRADGYGRADGCVVMVLERAVEGRQYEAMIDAITVNHDGRSVALTAPNGEAQCELISECLKQTRGSTLVAWECHGTGTSLGDPIEIKALQKAISNSVDDHNLKLGSEVWLSTAKATIGHTEAAAGLVGVMKAVLQLQNQSVPMLPDFRSLNPQIQLKSRFKFPINNPVNLKVDSQSICGVSAFGVGGTNACAVISRSCPLIDDEEVDELPRLIPVSAKSEHSLQLLIQKTSELLNSKNWSLISAAAALYRRHYEQRAVILKSGVLERLKFAEKPKVQIKIQQTDQSTDFWKVIPRLSQTKGTQLTTTVQWLLNVGFETEDFDLRNPLISASINGKSMDTRKDEHFVFNFCFNSSPPLTLATRSPEDVEKAIGYLYASMGREVKWTKLFDRMVDSERVLSAVKLLPSYQFDLSRFWRSEANFGAREFDHPLIGNPIDYKGQVAGKFEGHVSYRRLATFFEHSGDFFTFGSAVEIASSIVVFCLPNRRLRIGKFEFDSAVPLTDDSWIGAEFSVSEQKECKIRFGVLMNTEIERVICELTAAVGEEETEEINSNAQLLPESMDQPKDFVTDGERRSSEFTETVIKLDFLIRLFNQNAVQIRLLTSRKLTRIARYSLNNKEVRCFDQSGNLLVILSSRIELKETESLLKERKEATAIPPSNLLANQQPSIDDLKNKIARLLQSSISDGMPLTNDHYDRGFFDLGADSLALVGFANELGRSGLPRITTSDLLANPTINSLASFIESKITLTTPTETLNLITEMPKESKEKKLRFAHIYETKLSTVSLPVKEEVEVGTPRTDEEEENATEALLYAVERCQLPTTPTTPRSTNFAALRSMRVRILLKPTALTQTTTAKGDLERETHVYIRHGRQRHNVTFAALARRLGGASAVEFTFGAPPLRFDAIEKEAATFNTAAISRLFVRLGRTLLDVRRPAADAANPMELSVRMEKTWQSEAENTNVGWLSAMAVAFLKSFCAENPTQFAFKFTERLRPLTEVKLEEREEEEEFLITPEIEDTKEIPSCWLITGGTSGIGWLMARHLSLKPTIRRVYLIGRRWPATEIANEIAAINSTSEEKRIEIKLADVCDRERLCELAIEIADWLQKTGESLGFIHSAGCVDDRLLSAQNVERFGRVLDPKCRGLMNLQFALNCAAIRPLLCVYNSSVSSVLGNTGQSNYAAANALLDYLAETSEKSISINWANWLEAGFAANDTVRGLLRRKGFYGLRTVEALRAFDWAVDHANCCSQVFVARADWRRMFEFRPELRSVIQQPFSENFDNMKRQVSEEEEVKIQLTASDSKLPIQIYDKNPEKLESLSEISDHTEDLSLSTSQEDSISINSKEDLRELLVAELSDLLHSSENLDPAAGFMELGVDSFGMFSLANTMNRRIGRPILNVIHLFEHSTINKLTEYLAAEMEKENVQENSNKNVPDLSWKSKRPEEFRIIIHWNWLRIFVAKAETKSQPMKRPNLIFLFAGHGSLYPKACSQLSREVPYIATQIRACSEAFETHLPTRMSIEKLLLEPDSSVASKSTRKQKERNRLPLAVEHAAIFTVGYSLARFWRHVGLEPTHLIGHSLGELIAVCIAGFLSLSDAAELVCLRATALEKHRGKGSMLALDADFARSHAADFGLQTAAVNGPRQIVLCGSQKNVTKAKAIAEQKREAATIVSDEYAFHSDKFVKSDHLKVLHRFDWSKIKPTSESPILISNLTAKPLEHYDRQYLKRHAQSTVEFWSCVETVLAEGEATFVEVTAGRVLTSLVQKILNSRQLRYLVVPTVHAGEPNELDTLKWTAQKLQLKGHPVDERAFGRAVGEDFVERAASAFTSSFRLAKSGSLNTGRHHLVAWPPRSKATDCKRGVSVRVQTVTQKPLSQESKTIDSIGTQLILHQRPVEVKELDIEIANEHQLFGIPIAPAAFQLKSLGAHLRLAEITMHDVRFAQKLHADELRTLETVYRDGRLQLKRSTADIGVSIVAQQHSSGQKMSTGGLAATLFSSCIVDVPEAPARRVSIHPPADLPAISSIRLQTGGTATSVPLELNSYVEVPAPPNSVAPQQKRCSRFPRF
ncbi:Fatty acid synthase [Aphelenchoides besseyi]|nr:Fatty acid synthase [Aphelenchoides besseyi]